MIFRHQVQLLTSTWPRIKTQSSLFTQVFKVLMQRSPVCREMFQKMSIVGGFSSNSVCDLNSHTKLLCELLDSLMTDLHQPAKIVLAKCQDVGAAHVNMNEKCCGVVFDQLGEAFTEVRHLAKLIIIQIFFSSSQKWNVSDQNVKL